MTNLDILRQNLLDNIREAHDHLQRKLENEISESKRSLERMVCDKVVSVSDDPCSLAYLYAKRDGLTLLECMEYAKRWGKDIKVKSADGKFPVEINSMGMIRFKILEFDLFRIEDFTSKDWRIL